MTNNDGRAIIIKSKIELFLEAFTHNVPTTLKIGSPTKSSANGCSLWVSEFKSLTPPLLKQDRIPPTSMKLFKTTIKGTSESGSAMPNKKDSSFIRSPVSIRKATLSPTEKRTISNPSSLRNSSSLRIIIPGIKVR